MRLYALRVTLYVLVAHPIWKDRGSGLCDLGKRRYQVNPEGGLFFLIIAPGTLLAAPRKWLMRRIGYPGALIAWSHTGDFQYSG